MSQFYEEEPIELDVRGKRPHLDYLGAPEADVIRQRAVDTGISSGNMESAFSQSTQPYGPVYRKKPVRLYKKRKSISYMDLLSPAKVRIYKSKRSRYVSKRRVYKKPLRRPRRVSKPVVRASCSCVTRHSNKPYARRAYKSGRYKSR